MGWIQADASWMRSFKLSQCQCAASSCRSVNAQLQAVAVWMRSFKLSQGECASYCCPADVGSGKRTQSFRLTENWTWNGGAVYFPLILLRHFAFLFTPHMIAWKWRWPENLMHNPEKVYSPWEFRCPFLSLLSTRWLRAFKERAETREAPPKILVILRLKLIPAE
jgi:hypothetical protein